MSRILIVDDEQAVCWALERALTEEGHRARVASSAEEAFQLVQRDPPEAILLDVLLPGVDGLEALGKFRQELPRVPVIVMTAFGNLDTAVRAIEGGAFDYLTKPFDLAQVLDAVARALHSATDEGASPKKDAASASVEAGPGEMVGSSPAMQLVFKRIALVAPRDACVLITGESGTGKELVARAIHRHSTRRDRPFLPVHIAALNPSLVESELFGHVKGAFTGAAQARPGLLALADGGTVFLDELADIPLPVQVKLLRVLEQYEILPVGSNHAQSLNIRILSATHQDLGRRVAESAFRHDLFFRLNVFQVHLPPLRERHQDIVALAEHFLRRFEPAALPLTADLVKHLVSQPWFGNVRELRNALEHAAIVSRGETLRLEHLPAQTAMPGTHNPADRLTLAIRSWLAQRVRESIGKAPENLYPSLLHAVEEVLLSDVMHRVQGNRWLAARWLGLSRVTVRKKLGRYDLTDAYRDEEPAEQENGNG